MDLPDITSQPEQAHERLARLGEEPWQAQLRENLQRLNARPWRGACPLCMFTLWCTDTEDEARQLVSDHIATEHAPPPPPLPQVWRDHE